MSRKEDEKLLPCAADEGESFGLAELYRPVSISTSPLWMKLLLVASLLSNVALVSFNRLFLQPKHSNHEFLAPLEYFKTVQSPYSGLSFDTPMNYSRYSDYTSSNATLAEEAWGALENLMAIQLPHDYIEAKKLPHSWTFPWDLDKRIYFPKIGHQLHCLKSMRRRFSDLVEKGESTVSASHVNHCLNALRQDLMCQADETPMPSLIPIGGLGEMQVMQCKNWGKFKEWVFDPERNACYKHANGYEGVKHPIERFQFCPEDSPYNEVMHRYFEVHGHREVLQDLG